MIKKKPLRKCIGCGERIEKQEMIRVIKTGEQEIRLDPTGKANGRGAYLHRNVDCLEKAIRTKGLERSFRISVDRTVYEQLKEVLADDTAS